MNVEDINISYHQAKKAYSEIGVDTDEALQKISELPISIHCWQSDDISGFENSALTSKTGGIQVTGNYKGKARDIGEVRADLEKVLSLVPGKHRVNLHAIYGDFGKDLVDRNEIKIEHFQSWIDWAKKLQIGLDFNPTCFFHPFADSGFTLSNTDKEIRDFWIAHIKRCRKIAAEMGKQLGTPTILNIWIPDGAKDIPIDRNGHRDILRKSLDEIFKDEYPQEYVKDSLESKLFGIGAEAMTVGSSEFYLGYAIGNKKLLCIDNGHFHPTEQVGDKISSILQFLKEINVHLTRSIRWDSDHVTTFNEDIILIAQEIIRNGFLQRTHISLDYFDASINRIGAYVTGIRASQLAFLYAMLEPTEKLKTIEKEKKNFQRLAYLEVLKSMPFGAVYDYFCLVKKVPVAKDYIADIEQYEKQVISKR